MCFKKNMHEFEIPENLKTEIVVCQQNLRRYIQIHQIYVSQLKNKKERKTINSNIFVVEQEIQQLDKKQKKMTKRLNNLLLDFMNKLKKQNISVDYDLGYGYVSRLLSSHHDSIFNATIPKELKRKSDKAKNSYGNIGYPVESQNVSTSKQFSVNIFEHVDSLKLTDDSYCNSDVDDASTKPLNEPIQETQSITPLPSYFPVNELNNSINKQHQQVSLLKPISERNFTPNCFKPIITKFEEKPVAKQIEKNLVHDKDNKIIMKKLVDIVTLNPIEIDSISPAINKGRLNLKEALNKARTSQGKIPSDNNGKLLEIPLVKDISVMIDKNITPLCLNDADSVSPIVSDDSSDNNKQCLIESNMNAVLTKESFLKIFGLYTHAYIEILEQKRLARRARRRRNINSTERKDFHYKGFNALERQYQVFGSKRIHSKKPILYSPPSTRAIKKRKFYDTFVNMKGEYLNSLDASYKSISTEIGVNSKEIIPEQRKLCVTCNKNGSTNDLSSCVFCCNFFHLRCHKHVFSSETLDQSENICPICLRKKQRETILLKNQERDKKVRDKLTKVNEKLHVDLAVLWNRYDNIEKEIYENHDMKINLMNEGKIVRNNVKHLMSFVEKFKSI